MNWHPDCTCSMRRAVKCDPCVQAYWEQQERNRAFVDTLLRRERQTAAAEARVR